MSRWYSTYITDKTGAKFFNGIHSESSVSGQERELRNHIFNAKKHPELYKFLDIETAEVVVKEI